MSSLTIQSENICYPSNVCLCRCFQLINSAQPDMSQIYLLLIWMQRSILESQQMALANPPTQVIPFLNFLAVPGSSAARVDHSHPAFLLLPHPDFCSHRKLPSSCNFCFGSLASPLLGLVASSGQKQAIASLLPGQTDHLCPDGNPTQWLWPPLLTVETRLSRLRSWGVECSYDAQHCYTANDTLQQSTAFIIELLAKSER